MLKKKLIKVLSLKNKSNPCINNMYNITCTTDMKKYCVLLVHFQMQILSLTTYHHADPPCIIMGFVMEIK